MPSSTKMRPSSTVQHLRCAYWRVMIAAIYARKSTEQRGVVDEPKCTARQVDPREELNERESSTEL